LTSKGGDTKKREDAEAQNDREESMASRVVVITGATRGLGRALVDGFSKLGHRVIGCGRSREEIDQLRREPGPAEAFTVVDVVSDPAVKSWADAWLARFGPPDLLINNAAVINRNAPLWEVPASEFDLVVDVNLKGVANVIRHVVPAMIERGSGVIVNLSSGWGRSTSPEVAPYCATKWGIESTFGGKASGFLGPEAWAREAVPFLLALGAKDNGKALTVPGQ
jgi:NAD(P)-dependent dehydrogenase (short-subunit alcohol dehydrogenase family)